jgi:hydroxymethylpyrimidine/phosphomethylpyrimidine kinase
MNTPTSAHPTCALTIAGSDPSGGAGIQADLKTFHRFGVYGQSVLTLITAQNTVGVSAVHLLPVDLVQVQIRAVFADIGADAVKTGALGSPELIQAAAECLAAFCASQPDLPLVVDPVLVSKHGQSLAGPDSAQALRRHLLPLATVITPNWFEVAALSGRTVTDVTSARAAGLSLIQDGAKAVLVKGGGHLATDLLLTRNGDEIELPGLRVVTRATHGTGCTFSAALTAKLAVGMDLPTAALHAKAFIAHAIITAPVLGQGPCTPVNHWA